MRPTPISPATRSDGSQWTTSAGVQYEERRLFATQILGRTLLTGQTSPQQAASQTVLSRLEPVRDLGLFGQEEVLLADRRLLLTAGLRADRSSANGESRQVLLLPQVRGIVPVRATRSAAWTRSSSAAPTGRPATGRRSARCSRRTRRARSAGTRARSSAPARATPTSGRSGRRSSRAASTRRWPTGAPSSRFTLYQKNITDLLLERTLAPSAGQLNQIFSSGSTLRNRGIEASLHGAAGADQGT